MNQIERNNMDDQAERMYELMRNESNRLKTFQMNPSWPKDYVDIKKMAKAGFFYAFNGDNVHCAFCRGQVCRWDRDDDPMSEHARHFTTCPFIMGGEVGNEPLGEDPFPGPKRPRPYDVCGMFPNFPPNDPRAQLYQNREEYYRHQQQSINHDQLQANQNQIEDTNRTGGNHLEQYNYSNHVGSGNYNHHHTNNQQQPPPQIEFNNRLPNINDHQGAHVIENNNRNNINNHRQPAPQPPNSEDSLSSENQQARYNSPVGSNTSNCSNSSNSLTGICKICYTNSIELLFLPCGHAVSCLSCAQRLHSCPFCRVTITTRIRSYYI